MKKLFSSGIFLVVALTVFAGMFAFSSVVSASSPAGTLWVARTAAEANNWRSVAYGNGLFVAVANTGTHRVMTSPDGITWTARTAAVANEWSFVTYGGGLFVAVSDGFSDVNNNRVMTSPDGINWTARVSAEASTWNGWPSEANRWTSVAYGRGMFIAVSNNGTGQLMTSPNGINWTIRTSPWYHIQGDPGPWVAFSNDYSGGTFHIVYSGSLSYFSSDGITWTAKGTAGAWGENKVWRSLASNNNDTFVAVSSSGNIRAMSIISNISWNARTVPLNGWTSVTYGGGLFVAVSESGAVMTSPLGANDWTLRTGISNMWNSVTYGNGTFVAVSGSGASRVMTSGPSVDGGWSAWSPASCPTACGQPASTLTRTCTNPTPSGGGADCSGSATQSCSATPACTSLPTLTTTTPVTNISQTTATGGGNISSNGGATVTVSGIVWSTAINPTTALSTKTTNGWAIGGPWTSNMTGLTANTLYHVRAYATNSVGTAYGADVTFTTTLTNAVPTVTTPTSSAITTTGATLGANVTSLGVPASISARGTCWGISSSPTTNCAAATGTTTGVFTHSRTGLTPGTLYYYRGYATNTTGTGYSSDGTFTTVASLPTLTTTTPVTSITQTTATGGGNISSNGGATVTVSGIVWSTAINPTTALSTKTTNGWAIGGPWTSNMTGLTANTLYHVRAYATNSVGTAYGADVTFTTAAIPTYVLTVAKAGTGAGTVTSNVGGINCGATCSASYSSGASVILTAAATTGTFTGWSGAGCSGTGTCTVSMSSARTVTATFTFTATIPTLTTTTPVTSITQTTATGGGNISSNGGATVTVSGIVWSTAINPTTALSTKTTNGWAIGGPWTSNMTGLTANTLYHVRAYATNSVGTAYGADVTFTTTVTPINGVLGDANGRIYPNGASSYNPYSQCSAGTSNNTTFPLAGATVFWQCLGSGGGVDSGIGSASQATPAVPVTIDASRRTIVRGESTTLTWNGNGPCTGTNFSTGVGNPPSGNVSVSPISTIVYTVNCSNGSASVTVRIRPTFIEN